MYIFSGSMNEWFFVSGFRFLKFLLLNAQDIYNPFFDKREIAVYFARLEIVWMLGG